MSCCLYRKGKNFRANHNCLPLFLCLVLAVAYIAKVRILEQITTYSSTSCLLQGCCLYRKGKNFRANHNLMKWSGKHVYAVAYIAKVRILEQITTRPSKKYTHNRCCLYRKGKNFRANHNEVTPKNLIIDAVAYIAKVRILEQITTGCHPFLHLLSLLLISQR